MTRWLFVLTFISTTIFFALTVKASELYRYQDSNGRWVFGDKKSLGNNTQISQQAEKVSIKVAVNKRMKPDLEITTAQRTRVGGKGREQWQLTNPLPVDVQHWLRVKGQKSFFTSVMAKPFETITLHSSDFELGQTQPSIEHFYLLGKPITKPQEQILTLPYLPGKQFKISQGFNGVYSHKGRGNIYAVDIAMPIGAYVVAVKDGIIADLNDGFSIGGATNYFLDKANHVTVMHSDGSYAIYAHVLYGSAAIKIGDKVQVGDVLARVGNTGFSTGPHLHFVLRYNSGAGTYSIPFKFITTKGARLPIEGQYYTAQ